ncbi:SRPBCC family protein [Plantactinospora siamensis]|uniref:SRPBCC family protein n=1 Tax=Plantactinospora siamensis TaxID=555372 RepID=A0ABV6P1W5_9ACTN
MTTPDLSTQIYQVFIKATPERVWQAITDPDETMLYFHGARITNTPERHISYGPDGSTWGDGPVLEWDPPRRLVHEWRSLYDEELAAEQPSRVSWDIEPQDGGLCLLTLTHDRLDGAPGTAKSVSGPGWMLVLSGLKTLLETGTPLTTAPEA